MAATRVVDAAVAVAVGAGMPKLGRGAAAGEEEGASPPFVPSRGANGAQGGSAGDAGTMGPAPPVIEKSAVGGMSE